MVVSVDKTGRYNQPASVDDACAVWNSHLLARAGRNDRITLQDDDRVSQWSAARSVNQGRAQEHDYGQVHKGLLFRLRSRAVCTDVVSELFAVRIVRLLFQKLFILDSGLLFQADG